MPAITSLRSETLLKSCSHVIAGTSRLSQLGFGLPPFPSISECLGDELERVIGFLVFAGFLPSGQGYFFARHRLVRDLPQDMPDDVQPGAALVV